MYSGGTGGAAGGGGGGAVAIASGMIGGADRCWSFERAAWDSSSHLRVVAVADGGGDGDAGADGCGFGVGSGNAVTLLAMLA